MGEKTARCTIFRFGIRDLLWAMVVVGKVIIVSLLRMQASRLTAEIQFQDETIRLVTTELRRFGGDAWRDDEETSLVWYCRFGKSRTRQQHIIGHYYHHRPAFNALMESSSGPSCCKLV
jgi:hypothetical protein